jgi:SgrR family transcriptional regulator
MQLMTYYLELRAAIEPKVEGTPIRVTLEELASILFCTTRNVKLVLKKMVEQEWITWSPGRGRGNVSQLTFHITSEEIISKEAMALAQKGDFQSAIGLIHKLKEGERLEASFAEWLIGNFGHKSVFKEEQCTETLRFPLYNKFHTLDPAHVYFGCDYNMIDQIFDTLVRYNNRTHQIEEHLAHAWEVNGDYTEWTFYLRKGVLFHHGRELTAQDVKYSLLRLKDPAIGSCHAWLIESIEEIEIWNRYALHIRLNQPNVLFLRLLTFAYAAIVPEEIFAESPELFARMPIGSGPFRIERNDDYMCKMRVFEGYFKIRPHLDQIEMWFLPDELMGTKEHLDWGKLITDHMGFTKHEGISMKQEEDWIEIEQTVGSSLLTFNLKKSGPQRHLKFRQAIDLVVGREQMIHKLGGNRIAPSSSFTPSCSSRAAITPLDLEQARSLLEEIDYAGETLRLSLHNHHSEDAIWIKSQCAKVGIPVEIVIATKSDMLRLDKILEADMILYQMVLENDYDLHIIQVLKQTNCYICAHLSNELAEQLDGKIIELMADQTEQGRKDKTQALLAMLEKEKAFLFLLHKSMKSAYHASIKGVKMNEMGWVDFRQIWFAPTPLINQDPNGNTG